jgi:hypothetical protein
MEGVWNLLRQKVRQRIWNSLKELKNGTARRIGRDYNTGDPRAHFRDARTM